MTVKSRNLYAASAAGFWLMVACAGAQRSQTQSRDLLLDSLLFANVVESLAKSATPLQPLRVDPRPLAGDPEIVSLFRLPESLQMGKGASAGSLAERVGTEFEARRRVLANRGTRETDAFNDAKCPGAMLPSVGETLEERRAYCPEGAGFYSAIVTMPRKGGAYVPGRIDERAQTDLFTVRAIVRLVSSSGSAESASDFVFQVNGGRVALLRRVALARIE